MAGGGSEDIAFVRAEISRLMETSVGRSNKMAKKMAAEEETTCKLRSSPNEMNITITNADLDTLQVDVVKAPPAGGAEESDSPTTTTEKLL